MAKLGSVVCGILLGIGLVGCASGEPTRGTGTGPGGGDGDANPGAGNGGEPFDDQCAEVRQEAERAVDVVWVIDSSVSMVDEFERVQKNLNAFMEAVEQSGANTRVVVITLGDPAAGSSLSSDEERYLFVGSEVDSSALYGVTLSTFAEYGDFLRPNAATHFVMVTDDNDDISPDEFSQQMNMRLGHPFTLHAIASDKVNGLPCANPACGGIYIPAVCGATAVGEAYNELADDTMGEQISICTEDWTMVFDRLEGAVIAGLPCEYALPESETEEGVDPNKVRMVFTDTGDKTEEFPRAEDASACGDATAWFYGDDQKFLKLCPEACSRVKSGGSMDIAFGCAPIIL